MKSQHLLVHYYHYYVREMRIKAYIQLLESYRRLALQLKHSLSPSLPSPHCPPLPPASVTLANMAQAFGVSTAFLDAELARFISAGRLTCKFDKVAGIVETNRPDKKKAQYQSVIKKVCLW